ncbi:MAG: tetratricopeptide repeat protein [Planctomycetota bacterium]|jgi:TolA-binding protein|nr:tetratricopeptide repeat protein [Planctomycetota bacterium]
MPQNPNGSFTLRLVWVVLCLACLPSLSWAAGEWEWTQGQGWVQGAGVSRPTAKEQLAYSYELEQRGEFMDAARQYFLLIQNFPDSSEAGVGLQRLARCLFEMENYYTSYQAIEQVIKTYPRTGRMSDLIEIELRIAKKMLTSQAATSLFDTNQSAKADNTRRALEIVNAVLDHDPYGPMAAEAYLVKGEGLLYIGDIANARTSFDKVLDDFPRSNLVERARLGILRCDSLMGQAKPQEVYEQVQVVRELEAGRREEGVDPEEIDDVEESINQLAEVEAAKMMEQAGQYKRMGTHNAVRSAEFLYKEVARRYPRTPQAQEARELMGTIKIPKEESRVAKAVKSISLNPFNWNRDPEPPWIVPQLAPEDVVMIDSGIGPIAGVPESDFLATASGAGLKPAALDNQATSADSGAAYPAEMQASGTGYSPREAGSLQELPGVGGVAPLATSPAYQPLPTTPNPIPSIADSDLVGSSSPSFTQVTTVPYSPPPLPEYPVYGSPDTPPPAPAPAPVPLPAAPVLPASPSIGPPPDSMLSDLIGPARTSSEPYPMANSYSQPPVNTTTYPTYPVSPASPEPAYPEPYPVGGSSGGWLLEDDFYR